MDYACKAGVHDGNARCRNMAPCSTHPQGQPLAPRPNVILLKINVGKLPDHRGQGGERVKRLQAAGVKVVERSPERAVKLAQDHLAQAERLGRDAYRIREEREGIAATGTVGTIRDPEGKEVFLPEAIDSGSPVFGRLGRQEVDLRGLMTELKAAGFRVTGTHVLARNWKPPARWLIEFSREGTELAPFPHGLFREFTACAFGQVDVWANPRDKRGEVVHTVNCGERREAGAPFKGGLRYADGDWAFWTGAAGN